MCKMKSSSKNKDKTTVRLLFGCEFNKLGSVAIFAPPLGS